MMIVKNRSEILFLYDVKWGNPNGDPMDENKPRLDQETDTIIVTDVRLKRTIRDYLKDFHGENLWVSSEAVHPSERMKELGITKLEDAIDKCIDVRLFGIVMPEKSKSALGNSLTGAVQFRYGRSLHKAKWELIQGTAAFTSKEGKGQRSIREEYVVPYALIAFYGVINEKLAEKSKLSEEDIQKLLDGIWNGTKNLITRSKMEQNPRLLVKINYKEGIKSHHGELDYLVKIQTERDEFSIRDATEYALSMDEFVKALKAMSSKIESIEYKADKRMTFTLNGEKKDIREILKEITSEVKELELE